MPSNRISRRLLIALDLVVALTGRNHQVRTRPVSTWTKSDAG
jgi:hypothetical protein